MCLLPNRFAGVALRYACPYRPIPYRMDPPGISEAIGLHWSNVAGTTDSSGRVLKVRWWQHPLIIRHINRIVCGEAVEGFSEGLNLRVWPEHAP